MDVNAKVSKRAKGKKGGRRNAAVGQSMLCIALTIAALISVLILLFTVDIPVSGIGLTGRRNLYFFP